MTSYTGLYLFISAFSCFNVSIGQLYENKNITNIKTLKSIMPLYEDLIPTVLFLGEVFTQVWNDAMKPHAEH